MPFAGFIRGILDEEHGGSFTNTHEMGNRR
jgi:hypothetical protein